MGATLALPLVAPQVASAEAPRITTDVGEASPGSSIVAQLDGWTSGVVTVSLCGNEARRGSEDCDLLAGQSVAVHEGLPSVVRLPVTLPPMPCPCIVRATDATSTVTAVAAFVVVGAPIAAPVERDPADVDALRVSTRLEEQRGSLADRLRAVLGGPVERRLVLRIENTSTAPIDHVVLSATVGRRPGHGEILAVPENVVLAPGASRTLRVPVKLSAPVHGRYVVSGTIFGGGRAVEFATASSVTPWGLLVVAALVAVDVTVALVLLWMRRHDRRAAVPDTPEEQPVISARTLDEQSLVGASA